MEAKPPAQSSVQLAHWMGMSDANTAGNVHGGTVMKLCDEAAGLAAIKHCRRRVVTAGMDRMDFLFPVQVGELVTFSATVNAAWRTSMEVGVRVEAENPHTGETATRTRRISRSSRSTTTGGRRRSRRSARSRRATCAGAARPSCGGPTGWPNGTRSSDAGTRFRTGRRARRRSAGSRTIRPGCVRRGRGYHGAVE